MGELVDEFRRSDEARGEAILDGAVSDRDGQMRLPPSRFSEQDQRASLGDEIRRQRGAEQRQVHGGLVREVKIIDRLEEGKRGATRQPGEAGLLALRDFLRHEDGEQLLVGPFLLLGAHEDPATRGARWPNAGA